MVKKQEEKQGKKYSKATCGNPKYIRFSVALEKINEGLEGSERLTPEAVLARIRKYETETGDIIIQKDPVLSTEPNKEGSSREPVLVDWDKMRTSIPSLIESNLLKNLIAKVENQQQLIHTLYEVMYCQGFLRRNL